MQDLYSASQDGLGFFGDDKLLFNNLPPAIVETPLERLMKRVQELEIHTDTLVDRVRELEGQVAELIALVQP